MVHLNASPAILISFKELKSSIKKIKHLLPIIKSSFRLQKLPLCTFPGLSPSNTMVSNAGTSSN